MAGVDLNVQDRVARITIDRPEVLNALDRESASELREMWMELEGRRDVGVIVVTGAGDRAFCVGADMNDVPDDGIDYWLRDAEGFGGLGLRMSLGIPIVARVNGYALGGGFELLLACDIAIAADDAQFGLPEPRVGMVPVGGARYDWCDISHTRPRWGCC